jgi:hypothetical protein
MSQNNLYVLIHSPLVGRLTWSLVAEEIRRRGLDVVVPALNDFPDANELYWKQHAASVSLSLLDIPENVPLILIAHSGAGPLLPVIRESVPNPVDAYVFVDAGIPQKNATRLDMMKSEDPHWAQEFQTYLEGGGQFPNWSRDDLREIVPNDNLCEQLVAEIHPRGLDFFTEPIPVFDGWPDAPCAYIQFSPPYKRAELEARQMGWLTYQLKAGHFHMLVYPDMVTDLILNAVDEISQRNE